MSPLKIIVPVSPGRMVSDKMTAEATFALEFLSTEVTIFTGLSSIGFRLRVLLFVLLQWRRDKRRWRY